MNHGEFRDKLRNALAAVIRFTRTASASEDGQDDACEGRGSDDEAPKLGVRRLWPFGIRSLPPEGVDALVVHANGGSTNGVMLGAESKAYGPSDLKTGETALYCIKEGTLYRLTEVGKVIARSAVDQDYDVMAQGSGNVILESEDADISMIAGADITQVPGGKVYVGAASGTQPIALGTTTKTHLDQIKTALDDFKTFCTNFKTEFNSHTHPETGATTSPPTTPFSGTPPTPSAVPTISSTKSETV